MSTSVACPSCGEPLPETGDFCRNCGEFLKWDVPDDAPAEMPTEVMAAAGPGTLAAIRALSSTAVPSTNGHAQAGRHQAAITVLEADELEGEEPKLLEAGDAMVIHARVRNQGTIVDEFQILVSGFMDWWDVDPAEPMHLLPFGAGRPESCEADVKVSLRPPRSWHATAGVWPVTILVQSLTDGAEVARFDLRIEIPPFRDVTADVAPQVSVGRRRGRFQFIVRNAGNAPVDLELAGRDKAEQCFVHIHPVAPVAGAHPPAPPPPGRLGPPHAQGQHVVRGRLGPGDAIEPTVVAKPVRPQLTGRPLDHVITLYAAPLGAEIPGKEPMTLRQQVFSAAAREARKTGKKQAAQVTKEAGGARVSGLARAVGIKRPPSEQAAPETALQTPAARTAEDEVKPATATCTYRQRAWLPWWTAILAAIAAIVLALLIKAYLARVPVPNVLGHNIVTARAEIKTGHLHGVEVPAVPPSWTVNTRKPGHPVHPLIPGEVFKQDPNVGRKRPKGSNVKLFTAVKPGSAPVPNLEGLLTDAAITELSHHGFTIGDIEPNPPPQGDVIVSQTPAAGTVSPRTVAVDVTLGKLVVVPNLVGKPLALAQQGLQPLGLVLGTVTPEHPRRVMLVAIQTPSAESMVQAGSEIDVTLGLPVPKVAGLRLPRARASLVAAGFALGNVTPSPTPANYVVTKQVPAAKTIAVRGFVALTLSPPPKPRPKPKPKPAAKPKPKPSSAAASVAVSAAAGSSAAAAASTLAKAGVPTQQVFEISAKVPAGKLIATNPPAGTKVKPGTTVTLIVSAGFPEVAVDNGHAVLALNGVTGKVVSTVAGGPIHATQPSWSPDGTKIAYVSSGRIFLTAAKAPSGPRALTPAGPSYELPTFPNATTAPAVIAAIHKRPGEADQLCLLAAAHPSASCITVPGLSLGAEIAWAPSGRELLVGAASLAPGTAIGLLELTTDKPFSTRAGEWHLRGLMSPSVSGAGVRAGAFSPSGLKLAVAENFSGPFNLALTGATDLTLTKAKSFAAPAPACTVQWRTDSQELLIQTSTAPDCSAARGALYRFDPASPGMLMLVAANVADPSWQPLPGVQ